MISRERVKLLNRRAIKNGEYILYWMQASQRAEYNHSLEYAILKANELNMPLVVFFGIAESYPEANERHYYFMLQGLREAQSSLLKKGIKMLIWHKSPEIGALELSKAASIVVVDRGYLRLQRRWYSYLAKNIKCSLVQVESNVVVPVEEASQKEDFSAATFRPRIKKKLDRFLVPLKKSHLDKDSLDLEFETLDIGDIEKSISSLKIDRSVKKVRDFAGGTSEAVKRLENFLKKDLDRYSLERNDPVSDCASNMSPYLHFGQISPLYIALRVLETDSQGKDPYLDELIVRRELSMNFVYYSEQYDSFKGLPQWARNTLQLHKKDKRQYQYTLEELENAQTHDRYWNAAQQEMRVRGKMHGYMRMYWGKKIIEWTADPEEAYKFALYLNNKYEIDGRDANGYAGVAWCFGKHDRPWRERPIFGKIRYMSEGGLKRKFDADKYAERFLGA